MLLLVVLPFKRLNKSSYTSVHLTSRHAHSSVVTNDSLQLIMIKFTRFTWTLTIKIKSRKFIIVRLDNYTFLPYIIINTPFESISTTAYTSINECILNISGKTLIGKCVIGKIFGLKILRIENLKVFSRKICFRKNI